jgi:(p)ppGpp synthase/HD superfamily hydrolase
VKACGVPGGIQVASLLHNTGHQDDLVAAGILHDTIENSSTTTQDIKPNSETRSPGSSLR